MIVLVPMGGRGTRFSQAGYTINKACIPLKDRHTGKELPMVVCAMKDIPYIGDLATKIVCVNRDFHETNGTETIIHDHFPNTVFIHDHVLLDQAFACYLARDFLDKDEPLFIGSCDNGIDLDIKAFEERTKGADVVMISHSGDENIAQNPNAHSWAELNEDGETIKRISLKQTVSDNFMNDHATTGMFWFKSARVFLSYLEKMLWDGDNPHTKHLIDRILQYYVDDGLMVTFHDVKYHCWGTPHDYESYQDSYKYWENYVEKNQWL